MIEKLQHKYALSRQGALDMMKACASVTITNIAYMMSAGVLYMLIRDLLSDNLSRDRIPSYIMGSVAVLAFIAVTNFLQYMPPFLPPTGRAGSEGPP